MLSEFIEKGLVKFEDGYDNWEEAVRGGCEKLVEKNIIEPIFVDSIVNNIKEHGPYIVLVPGIAMPHSTQGGEGVRDTAISFMKINKPVYFDEEKYAQLFFTLAAVDNDKHFENMAKLMELLMNEEVVEKLYNIHNVQELETLAKEYSL